MILKEHFTKDSFKWLIGEIKARFMSSKVVPGEMVGSIGA